MIFECIDFDQNFSPYLNTANIFIYNDIILIIIYLFKGIYKVTQRIPYIAIFLVSKTVVFILFSLNFVYANKLFSVNSD